MNKKFFSPPPPKGKKEKKKTPEKKSWGEKLPPHSPFPGGEKKKKKKIFFSPKMGRKRSRQEIFQEVIDALDSRRRLFCDRSAETRSGESSRNIRDVKMVRSEGVNVYDLLKYDHCPSFSKPSVHKIEGALIS